MSARFAASILTAALYAAVAQTVGAQGLADVAKREAERRGTVTSTAKVYTNGDLVNDFTKPAAPVPAPAPAPPQSASVSKNGVSADADEAPQQPVAAPGTEVERQASSDKGEDYWRHKAAAIRAAIAGQREQIAAIETRVSGLVRSETAADQREGALSSDLLTKAKADLVSLEQEKARFEDLAKKKNVPSAWLR